MNEQNFDKIFGDKLNEGIDFNFTEQKWGKMEKHLNAFQAEKGRKRLLAWLLLPLLAFIGLLTWGGWLLHDAQRHISELTEEIHDLRLEKHTPSVFSLKNDTIYHHIVIRRYDTIFQTVVQNVVGKFISHSDSTHFAVVHIDPQSTEKQAITYDSTKTSSAHFQSLQDLVSVAAKSNEAKKERVKASSLILTNTDEPQKIASISTSTPLSINDEKAVKDAQKSYKNEEKGLENKDNDADVEHALEKQKHLPILNPIKIAGYELGILGGFATINRPNTVQQNGFSLGVKGGILLGERWKIVGETQYLFLSYETDKITPDLDIKIITPPTPNDSLDGVKVKQPYWQYALGLQYVLSQKRLKPFIGINLLGQSKLKEEFEYEYLNTVSNTPVFVQTVRKEKAFQAPFIRLQLGVSYPIFGKINAQLEGSYDAKLGNTASFKPLWQVKTVCVYRF